MYHKNILKAMISSKLTEQELKRIVMQPASITADYDKIFSSAESLVNELGINSEAAEAIVLANPEPVYDMLNRSHIKMITEAESAYPSRLIRTLGKNSPPVLFLLGNTELLYGKNAGFTGSRRISQRGEFITQHAAKILSANGITVVSGYASGSDMAAHISALSSGGTTVFVLAEGIFNFRFKQDILQLISSENCLFVSQFSPLALWSGDAALKRNETIIGLSDAVILTEAAYKSGTYSTGSRTLKFDVPLFVYDYAAPPSSAAANCSFISRGAKPLRGKKGIPNLSYAIELINSRHS